MNEKRIAAIIIGAGLLVAGGIVYMTHRSKVLSFPALQSAAYIFNNGYASGKLPDDGSLQIEKNHIGYGDLNGDKEEDAALILNSNDPTETLHDQSLVAVLNNNGMPMPIDAYDLGINLSVNSLQIESGKIIVNVMPAGTSQNQAVAFDISTSTIGGEPELALSFSSSTELQAQNLSSWMTYQSSDHGFSFKYPPNYFLRDMGIGNGGQLILDQNVGHEEYGDPTGIQVGIQPITNFSKDIITDTLAQCGGNGSAGLPCLNDNVITSPITTNGIAGYKTSIGLQPNPDLPGEVSIYFFRMTSSTMLEIYGFKNDDLTAVIETLSR